MDPVVHLAFLGIRSIFEIIFSFYQQAVSTVLVAMGTSRALGIFASGRRNMRKFSQLLLHSKIHKLLARTKAN